MVILLPHKLNLRNILEIKTLRYCICLNFNKNTWEKHLCLCIPASCLIYKSSEFLFLSYHVTLQGKAGSKPTVKELASALESHELFIYFGHGSGKA